MTFKLSCLWDYIWASIFECWNIWWAQLRERMTSESKWGCREAFDWQIPGAAVSPQARGLIGMPQRLLWQAWPAPEVCRSICCPESLQEHPRHEHALEKPPEKTLLPMAWPLSVTLWHTHLICKHHCSTCSQSYLLSISCQHNPQMAEQISTGEVQSPVVTAWVLQSLIHGFNAPHTWHPMGILAVASYEITNHVWQPRSWAGFHTHLTWAKMWLLSRLLRQSVASCEPRSILTM